MTPTKKTFIISFVAGCLTALALYALVWAIDELATPEPATVEQHKQNVASCNRIGGQVIILENEEFARCYVKGVEAFNWVKPEEAVFEEGRAA